MGRLAVPLKKARPDVTCMDGRCAVADAEIAMSSSLGTWRHGHVLSLRGMLRLRRFGGNRKVSYETYWNKASAADMAEAADEEGLRAILKGTEIPVAYKIGYILNFYREPSFRRIEAEFGLTRPEIVILLALHFREGITAAEFCEFSGHLKAGVSRAAIALDKKGLIERRTDAADSRRQRLFLTAAGRALYQQYIPALKAREAAMLSCLTAGELAQFEGLLDKLAVHVPVWGSLSEL